MRNSLIIALFLVFLASACLAGTDNSALQVFTLSADKMGGYSGDFTLTEDTGIPSYTLNAINFGNALIKTPIGSLSATNLNIDYVYSAFQSEGLDARSTIYATCKMSSGEISLIDAKIGTLIYPSVTSTVPITGFNYYRGGLYTYLIGPLADKIVKVSNGGVVSTFTPALDSTENIIQGCLWNGRIFLVTSSNTIVYSTASDVEDYKSANGGGAFRLSPESMVLQLMPANNLLYILTVDGMWVLYGDSPESWRIEKISDISPSFIQNNVNSVLLAKASDNSCYYVDKENNICQVVSTSVKRIAKIPVIFQSDGFGTTNYHFYYKYISCFGDNLIALSQWNIPASSYVETGKTYLYDLTKKQFWITQGMDVILKNQYMTPVEDTAAARSALNFNGYYVYDNWSSGVEYSVAGVLQDIKQNGRLLDYETAWISLDNNLSTRKKIMRVEIDMIKGSGTYECILTPSLGSNYARTFSLSGGITTSLNLLAKTKTVVLNVAGTFGTYLGTTAGGTVNAFKLRFKTEQPFVLKQIRVYYYPTGGYNTKQFLD